MVQVTGSFEYEIKIEEEKVDFKLPETLEAELAVTLAALSVVKYSKELLTKSVELARGKDLKKIKFRLYRLNTTEAVLSQISDDMLRAIQKTKA